MDNDDRETTALIFTGLNFIGFIVSFLGLIYNLKNFNENAAWALGFLTFVCLINGIVVWLTNFYAGKN